MQGQTITTIYKTVKKKLDRPKVLSYLKNETSISIEHLTFLFQTVCMTCSQYKPAGEYVICHDSCGIGGTYNDRHTMPQLDFKIENI